MPPPPSPEQALALHHAGNVRAAIDGYRDILCKDPENAAVWQYLAVALRATGDLAGARSAAEKAVKLAPQSASAWNNLGNSRAALADPAAALADYQKALEINPQYADAWANRGLAEKQLGHLSQAITCFEQAAAASDRNAGALNTIGNQLFELHAFDGAITCYRRAVEIDSRFTNAFNNLGNTYLQTLQIGKAIAAYGQALKIDPDHPDAANGYGQSLLLTADYSLGWPAYEARKGEPPVEPATGARPWTGQDLVGRTLLLRAEQGMGDTIQFLRFAGAVKKTGATVVLQCPEQLADLARTVDGIDRLCRPGDRTAADFTAPLMSLPHVLGLKDEQAVKMDKPYMSAPRPAVRTARRKQVGLVWAGNPDHINDANRSMDLADLAPIFEISTVDFFSLQMGPAKNQLTPFRPAAGITDVSSRFTSYGDTANTVANLDLLISVDTSLAHLAGAMGKPCWLLLPYVPDWRWQLERPDSPWYPSLILFRQTVRGNWQQPVEQAATLLSSQNPAGP